MDISVKMAIEIVERIGFPILICMWFMFRNEKKQNKILEILDDISSHLEGE